MTPAAARWTTRIARDERNISRARLAASAYAPRVVEITSAEVAAISRKSAGVIESRSTTSGMMDRKNTITLGLPSVRESEPENARQPRAARAGGRAAPDVAEARAMPQAI